MNDYSCYNVFCCMQGGNPFPLEMRSSNVAFVKKRSMKEVWRTYMFQLVNGTHLRYFSKMNIAVSRLYM